MGRKTEQRRALDEYYHILWAALSEREQQYRREIAARAGALVDEYTGLQYVPAYGVSIQDGKTGKTHVEPRLRPLHFRLLARHGDRKAQEYCDNQMPAIPWNNDYSDAEFERWERAWLKRQPNVIYDEPEPAFQQQEFDLSSRYDLEESYESE